MAENEWSTPLPESHTTSDTSPVAPWANTVKNAIGELRQTLSPPAVSLNNTTMRVVSFGNDATVTRPANVPNGGVYWVGTGTNLPANAMSADLVYVP